MLTLFTPRKCSRATTSLTEEKPSLRDRVLLFSLCYGSPAAQTSKGSRSKKLKVTHRLWCCCYTRRQWAVQVLEKKTSDDIHVYYYKVSRGDEDWKHHRPTESTMRYGRLLIHYTMRFYKRDGNMWRESNNQGWWQRRVVASITHHKSSFERWFPKILLFFKVDVASSWQLLRPIVQRSFEYHNPSDLYLWLCSSFEATGWKNFEYLCGDAWHWHRIIIPNDECFSRIDSGNDIKKREAEGIFSYGPPCFQKMK